MQQCGANFTCTTTRDNIIYNLDVVRDYLPKALDLMKEVFKDAHFKNWEYQEVKKRVATELELLKQQPEIQVVELLHQAAYREDSLGRSLYAPAHRLNSISADDILAHMDDFYSASHTALVGVGCPPSMLEKIAGLYLRRSAKTDIQRAKSRYFGGERRLETGNPVVHVLVASDGVGLNAPVKKILSAAVLQRILGGGARMPFSHPTAGRLSSAVTAFLQNPFTLSAVNTNYSDGGLFGFHLICNHMDVGRVCETVVKTVTEFPRSGITDVELARAKAQIKVDLRLHEEDSLSRLEDWGTQLVTNGGVLSRSEVDKALDSITSADVVEITKSIFATKPSVAAVGNLAHTPYRDDLF